MGEASLFSNAVIIPAAMQGERFFLIAGTLAYLHTLYPRPFIPGFVGFLAPAPEH